MSQPTTHTHTQTRLAVAIAVVVGMLGASCGSSPVAPAAAGNAATMPGAVTAVVLTSTLPMGSLPRVRRGTQVTFSVAASGGTSPIEFRWKANGIVLRGWSTTPTFTWDCVTTADGQSVATGRMYFWVEARGGGRAESERGSDVLQFDVE